VKGSGRGLIKANIAEFAQRDSGKSQKFLGQDSRCVGRNLNSGPPEYDVGMLTTLPQWIPVTLNVFQKDLDSFRNYRTGLDNYFCSEIGWGYLEVTLGLSASQNELCC
jgi:hypothetical protein